MRHNPLVSILVPVYNVETYLPHCLDSLVGQTYPHLQIVLIDDGSTDGSWRVMQEFAARDERIEIYHQENLGVGVTRNRLLEKIKGDYVLFVDSDDWVELDMVEFLVGKVLLTNSSVVTCSMVTNDDDFDSTVYKEDIWTQSKTIREFLRHETFRGSLCNKLVATCLLHNQHFHCEISYGEDALFCWGFLQNASRVLITDKVLYHYRMNMDSISHQSFGRKKLTGHETWRIINEECEKWWPQYIGIAQARWGMEDMYLLRQAGQSNFKKNDAISQLQQTVKRFIPQMKSTGLLKGKEIFNANIMCRWYHYGMLYNMLNQIKRKFI